MKILNYGAGALGLGIDSCLLKSGETLDMIARPLTTKSLNSNGLKRTGIFGDFSAPPSQFRAYSSLKEIANTRYDFILVSTKSFDSAFAAQDIANHPQIFHQNTKIVLCQNGWGNAEMFAEHFPKEKIYSARVITGFTRTQPHEVMITVHADAIKMGSLFDAGLACLRDLCRSIAEGGIPCEISQDIQKDLWAKLLYNCALNPLGAILDVPYGTLGEQEDSRIIMNEIIREIFSVMEAAGFHTHPKSADDYQEIFYSKLIPATAKHKSSTLQSLKAGKRTEVDALTGIIVKLAEQHHIPVPTNLTIYRMIKFIEGKNSKKGQRVF